MGRKARTLPVGKFVLRTPKATSDGQMYAIYIYYYWRGTQIRRSTDMFVAKKDWNEKGNGGKGEFKPTYGKRYREMNLRLQRMIGESDSKILKYIDDNKTITSDIIMKFLNGEDEVLRQDKGYDFVDFGKERYTQRYQNKGIGVSTWKNAESYLNQFRKFLRYQHKGTHGTKNELLYVSEINVDLVAEFAKWYGESNKVDTVNKVVQCIACICKYAAKLGFLPYTVSIEIGDLHISDKDFDNNDKDMKYLTAQELRTFSDFKTCLRHPRQIDFHDMFMFSFYSCGLRMVDIITLRWTDIDLEKKMIKKVQIKTGNRNIVPYLDPAAKILDRWKGRNKVYVFDLLDENFKLNDDVGLQKRRNSIDRTANASLKKQSDDAKLGKSLTFHMARHTWAVLALQGGVNISKISALLGHQSTAVTERVYAEFLPDDLAEVVKSLNFDFG